MNRYRSEIAVYVFLTVTILAVYWQVYFHDFVNYDNSDYLTENDRVKAGWTVDGVIWAFTTRFHGHWHPLTWLSHMTDCQLFGLDPGWHHLTSLFFHIANTLLLFFVFKRMTGALIRSAFVAALFALHPFHVETVVWIADRKDVLCTFFWILTMIAYVRYSERPGLYRYLLVFIAFVLGLMAKSMIITLPLIFILMDYWPLNRFSTELSNGRDKPRSNIFPNSMFQSIMKHRLIWEKALVFIFMAIAAVLTVLVRKNRTAFNISDLFSKKEQLFVALTHYLNYIGRMFWPFDLAIPFPPIDVPPIWQVVVSGLILACITFLAFWVRRKYPYFLIGWLWYIISFVPVIGIIKGGPNRMADRYTYIPFIGLFVIIAWGIPDLVKAWRYRKVILAASTGILFFGLMVCTWSQIHHWKNSLSLFTHAINVTTNNVVAHNMIGVELVEQGESQEAIEHFSRAIEIAPDFFKAHNNISAALERQGKYEDAIEHLSKAIRIEPNYSEAYNNIGVVLEKQGKYEEAIEHYSKAIRIKPNYSEAYNNIGVVLERQGKYEEAIKHYSKAIRIKPNYSEAYNNIGVVLERQGKYEEAIKHYSKAIKIRPDFIKAHNNMGLVLVFQGNYEEAIKSYSELIRIKPGDAKAHNDIGVVLTRQGKFNAAIEHYQKALKLNPKLAVARQNLDNIVKLMKNHSSKRTETN